MIHVHRPYIGSEEKEAVARVLDSRWLGMGSFTKAFEEKLREQTGARHVFAVNTGTAALHLALGALELDPEDEVILPSMTFVSTVQAVLAAGGRPVFCEVSDKTLNMDIDDAFARVTSRTKVILPVHYAGLPCDMDMILSKARPLGIKVIEDAAHAFGSSYKGRMVGSLGDMTCFSFDPIKNITCGGGGAVTTDDDGFAKIINTTRNVGMESDSWERINNEKNWHYDIVSSGFRYCMSNLNAAIGLEQLLRFNDFKKRKQSIVARYDEAFDGIDWLGLLPHDPEGVFPFSYVVKVKNGSRDRFILFLKDRGIGTTVQFIPNHMHKKFAEFKTHLPITEKLYDEIVTLPLYYEMEDADVDMVISSVVTFFRGE